MTVPPSQLGRALADWRPERAFVPADPTVAAVVDYARTQRDTILATDPAVRRDEPEAVHDMRVAIRRLRSTLRTFRPLWNQERAGAVRDELKWLADLLGPVRDGEVMLHRLTAAVRDEPPELVVGPVAERIREWLTGGVQRDRQRLLAALGSPRYLALLVALDELLDPAPQRVAPRTLRARAAKALRRADRDLDAAVNDAAVNGAAQRDAAADDRRLHEARKEFKRARYAVEALAPVAGRPATRLAKKLGTLQDVLGTHQDTVVTQQRLLEYARRAHARGDDAFTYGLLSARQREAGERVLRELPSAVRRARRGKLRRWLR